MIMIALKDKKVYKVFNSTKRPNISTSKAGCKIDSLG